jgi:putative nucleotidyltransferase-like protein
VSQPEFSVSPAGHVARMLVLDAAALELTGTLNEAGVETILLKGPSISRWVYWEDDFRPYSDLDLLVAPGDLRGSLRVLTGLGFERVHSDAHAELLLRRSDQVMVDLHRLIVGVGLRPEDAWAELTSETEPFALQGGEVVALSPAGRAFHVVLHAAQHGARDAKPLRDLAQGLERLPQATWEEAAALARRLRAEAAFLTGLRLLPAGRAIAESTGVSEQRSVEAALRAGTAPPAALGLYRFFNTPGAGPKAQLLASELFPSAAFMRAWTPLARRGPAGLTAAYVWRPLWLLLRLGPALHAWQRARRAAR